LPTDKQSNDDDGAEFPADLLVDLDRTRPRSLRAQLEQALRAAITSGSLAAGTVLPPSRALAADLNVSRSLVVAAYEQLLTEGYLEARQGAGTRVRARGGRLQDVRALVSPPPAAEATTWNSGLPDPALFPRGEWVRHYREVLRDLPDEGLNYPHPQGTPELRAALTAYLGRVRGVRTGAGEVVICSGFSQGLVLLCRVLGRQGVTRVAVEDPCFSFHRRLISQAGLGAVPVPVDEQGMLVSRLAGLHVGAVVLSPAHSYPSGATLCADRRVQLLQWAAASGALVIEDDYDAEFRYDRLPVGALQGLDPAHVVYGGSASKILSPVLRLGWLVVPPDLITDVIRAKFYDDYSNEGLGQLALARFIDSGALTRHLRRVRPIYRSRRDSLLTALGAHLPGLQPTGQAAGLHLLLRLPVGLDANELCRLARRHRLPLENAARHWADRDAAPPAVVIGYGTLREGAIARGVEYLGRDLGHATSGPAPGSVRSS